MSHRFWWTGPRVPRDDCCEPDKCPKCQRFAKKHFHLPRSYFGYSSMGLIHGWGIDSSPLVTLSCAEWPKQEEEGREGGNFAGWELRAEWWTGGIGEQSEQSTPRDLPFIVPARKIHHSELNHTANNPIHTNIEIYKWWSILKLLLLFFKWFLRVYWIWPYWVYFTNGLVFLVFFKSLLI